MLIKQGIDISFAQGLDTKTDPKRVTMGKFTSLQNSVFTKGGLLQKRNGYASISSLPNDTYSYLTTFNNNLTAIGTEIAALNNASEAWVTRGMLQPMQVATLPLIRNNLNQTACDAVVAPNGLVCTVYLESNGSTVANKYAIADSVTGQNIVPPTVIPVSSGTVSGGMRVFVLGVNFVIVFTNTISGTAHLQYIAISTATPTTVTTNADIASAYVATQRLSWDGFVVGSHLYVAYDTTTGGQAVKVTYLAATSASVGGAPVTAKAFSGYTAALMSVTADVTGTSPIIWLTFYDGTDGWVCSVDSNLNTLLPPLPISLPATALNIASAAQNGQNSMFFEMENSYTFDSSIPTNFIIVVHTFVPMETFTSVFSSGAGSISVSSATGLSDGNTILDVTTPSNIASGTTITNISGTTLTLSHNTAGNSASSPGDTLVSSSGVDVNVSVRSIGLASKAFIVDGIVYYLAAYQSSYQSTYFLINGSVSRAPTPVIAGKLAYENGGGYLSHGLPNVTITGGTVAQFPYLFKDLIQAVNKDTNVPSGTQVAGIYSQTGINLATVAFGTVGTDTAEIGNDLHISGGFLWMYDGYSVVEHNFFLWPDTDQTNPTDMAAWSATGGSMAAQPDGSTNTNAYWYQFTYEWTDNQGNAFRSAPSIPIAVTTTGSGTSGSVTLNIPTLRLTMKTANPVKIVVYRWSVGQEEYYQTTSISSPLLNDTTVDYVTFVDTNADATILGNNLIYTTGGVLEDVNAPATNIMALFDTRFWMVDAEDQNLVWFSKQVIEATPVEMSDLLTMYIPPTVGTEVSTGPIRTLFPMDDKLIFGKKGAFVYINGSGPDNTGHNSQYSPATFITATVGCDNQQSFVLIPQGLMFQSDKGIWLLDRGLGTEYIGAPVEQFTTGATVMSAVNIPEANQVRFTMSSGITLMYDYFYDQWGTFVNVPAVSSTIFENQHTYINASGAVFQESPGTYLDGSEPVLMQFTTGPLRLGELQYYQRAYFFYLLGTYLSPHKLAVSIYHDYNVAPAQSVLISPINYSAPYGSGPSQSPYGQGNPYGGPGSLEQWRVFFDASTARSMAIGIGVQEIFDATLGAAAGAGLTLSGINFVCGFKKAYRPQSAKTSTG